MKTSELTGAALDWAVAKCENGDGGALLRNGIPFITQWHNTPFFPSRNWVQGGPIIEREFITLRTNACVSGHWSAFIDFGGSNTNVKARQSGPTPLIAAMRCYVASKLGGEIEIPAEIK